MRLMKGAVMIEDSNPTSTSALDSWFCYAAPE